MQPAGDFIGVVVEFPAGVEHGEDKLERRHLFFFMIIDRYAATVIDHRHGIVLMDDDIDGFTVTGKRLVDRVVNHLIDQMMQSGRARAADVHRGTHSHRIEAFKGFDAFCTVLGIIHDRKPLGFQAG